MWKIANYFQFTFYHLCESVKQYEILVDLLIKNMDKQNINYIEIRNTLNDFTFGMFDYIMKLGDKNTKRIKFIVQFSKKN